MTYLFSDGLWADRYLLAGGIAGLLSIVAFLPYIRDTWRGVTRPDRACWLIWAVLATISGVSHMAEGADGSMFYVSVQVGATLIVFALSFVKGTGRFFRKSNVITLGLAGAGLLSWAVMDTAIYAMMICIAVSALGGIRTAYKAYLDPNSETVMTWGLLIVSAGFGVVSVGVMDAVLLAYPLYLLGLYSAILMAIGAGRLAQQRAAQDAAWYARRAQVPPLVRRQDAILPSPEFVRANVA